MFWALLIVSAATLWQSVRRAERTADGASDHCNNLGPAIILLLGLTAVGLTLFSHRSDADDEFYVNVAISLLSDEAKPLKDVSIIRSAYALASYQAIEAAISSCFAAPFLSLYYLIAPAAVAFVSVFAAYRLFLALSARGAILTTMVYVAVLFAWGEIHRTPGNFGFVRLFQGKAVFALAIVPFMLLYAIQIYRSEQSLRSVFLLTLAVSAGIGATQTAFLITPFFLLMAVALLLPQSFRLVVGLPLAPVVELRSIGSVLVKELTRLSPIVIPFILCLAILVVVGQRPQRAYTDIVASQAVAFTSGAGFRGVIAFGCLALLPWMVRSDLRMPLATFIVGAFILSLSPPLGFLLDWINAASAWRIIWLLPLAPAVAVCVVQLLIRYRQSMQPIGLAITLAGLAVFVVVDTTTLSARNQNLIGWPKLKIPEQKWMLLRGEEERRYSIANGRLCVPDGRCF